MTRQHDDDDDDFGGLHRDLNGLVASLTVAVTP